MLQDKWGLEMTAASAEAVAAFDHAIDGYLGYRSDLATRVEALFAADPDCGLAHCFRGYLAMLSFNQAAIPAAQQASARTWDLVATGNPREHAHAGALDAWANGEPARAAEIWDQIVTQWPHDILAFRLAHFINFWLGRPDAMLASVLAVEKHWSEAEPGYGSILGCRCFAHEESGYYTEAESAGREAVRRDPGDLWAAHGVAHVMEMQGRRGEGIAWIASLEGNWEGRNNLRHHLWWHQAMFHLDRGDAEAVLRQYDTRFRDLSAPLTKAFPDMYIDVQNAASMLFRLARQGVAAGGRWDELADKAEARIGDCLSAFTLPHWMMALAATGREAAGRRMLEGMRDFAQGPSSLARLVGDVALPVTEAVMAHGLGQYERAVTLMRPVLGEMYRLGGSHAQQDVLEQLFLDSALKAGLTGDARTLLERVAGRHPVQPHHRRGYAMAAGLLALPELGNA